MSLTIAPAAPQQTQAQTPLAQLLVPGATVEARVLQQISTTLVRMVIAATAVDVASPIPLPIGVKLRLAVTSGEGGPQLTVLSSTPSSPQAPGTPVSQPSLVQAGLQGVVLKPVLGETVSAPSAPLPQAAPPSPAEALSQAAQQAAPRQGGLSPLFANLNVALASGKLPPGVLQAAFSLLSIRPQLSEEVSATDIRAALQRSGLFLESSLAQGRAPTPVSPDLKAALLVFREALSQWLGDAGKLPAAIAAAAGERAPSSAPQSISVAPQLAGTAPAPAQATAIPTVDAPPTEFVEEIVIPRTPAGMPAMRHHDQPVSSQALPRQLAQPVVGAVLTFVQEIEQNLRDALSQTSLSRPSSPDGNAPRSPLSAPTQSALPQGAAVHVPPPPFRGSDPSAQMVAAPSLAPDDTSLVMGHRLLNETDAAVARQTLFQIASMPESSVQQAQRSEHPRWAFEVPFATPQGTAVAQFEVERDAKKDTQVEQTGPVWRARFSLNVEPAGPVHAVITLVGGQTTVRLWAERAETAAQLRDGTPLLSHALREAELQPGDITVGGAAPAAKPPAAGHFLDRAT